MKAILGIDPQAGTVTLWPLAEAFRKPSWSSAPFLCQNSIQHLVLAFFVGVLLTLLLLVLVFLIVKSYRKCKWSPRDGTALLALTLRISLGVSSDGE